MRCWRGCRTSRCGSGRSWSWSYLDLSEAQIADLLQISKGSVKAHASRALATLGARLEAAR